MSEQTENAGSSPIERPVRPCAWMAMRFGVPAQATTDEQTAIRWRKAGGDVRALVEQASDAEVEALRRTLAAYRAAYDALRDHSSLLAGELGFAAATLSSEWPERCQEIVRRARTALALPGPNAGLTGLRREDE